VAYGSPQLAASDGGRLAYKWKVLISVIFGVFMVILDTTVVNVAFQTLRVEYGVDLNQAQWIISIYVLALGIATPLAGFLADRFGMKRVYVTGLGLFVLGSFLCGIAPSFWFLVGARALQGLGGGIAMPLGSALLLSSFPAREQGTALGIFGVALVVAPALGPILGGFMVDQGLWRWIFFINVPIGLLGIFLASRWLRPPQSLKSIPLDMWGLLTAAVGAGAILYGASIIADHGWTDPQVLALFAVGLVSLAIFAYIELFRADYPLLNLRLFQNRVFLNASMVGWVSVLALFGAEFLMPLYLQALRGLSALQTGFTLLPLAVAAAIATPVAGRFYDKIGPRPLVVTGFSILALNTWQLSQLQADTPVTWIMLLLALRGIALGMTVQTTFVTALGQVPIPQIARASSLVNSSRQLVQALGVAVLATVLASTLSPQVRVVQAQFQEQAAQNTAHHAGLCQAAGMAPSATVTPSVPPETQPIIRQACIETVAGFEKTYLLTFVASLIALGLGAFLPGWPMKWAGRRPADAPQAAASGH